MNRKAVEFEEDDNNVGRFMSQENDNDNDTSQEGDPFIPMQKQKEIQGILEKKANIQKGKKRKRNGNPKSSKKTNVTKEIVRI